MNSVQKQPMELTVASNQCVMATAWRSTVVVRIKNALKASGTVMQMKTVLMAWCADSTIVEILQGIQLTEYPPVQKLTAANQAPSLVFTDCIHNNL